MTTLIYNNEKWNNDSVNKKKKKGGLGNIISRSQHVLLQCISSSWTAPDLTFAVRC